MGLFPVHTHAGIRRGVLVHAPLHDFLQAHEPVGLTLGAVSPLFWHSRLLEDEMLTDLLVCQETVVLVEQDVLHQEGHVLEDPAEYLNI